MKKSKKALLWTIVPVLGVSSGVAGAVAGVTNQKTSVDTNNVATSSSATTMATRSTSSLEIGVQPDDVLVFSGDTSPASMNVYVKGSGEFSKLRYEWKVNKGDGKWTTYQSSRIRGHLTIDIPVTNVLQTWTFRCEITSEKTGEKIVSKDAKFTVAPNVGRNIRIKQPESNKTALGGEQVTLTTEAKGTGIYATKDIGYQWFEYDSENNSFIEIDGATGSSYTFTAPSNTTTSTTKKYVCRYYIVESNKTRTYLSESNQSIVNIKKDTKEEIKVTLSPNQAVKVDEEITLSAIATSTKTKKEDLKYQWYESDAYGKPYKLIEGANSSEYKYKATKANEGKLLFFCVLVTGSVQDGKLNHFQSGNVEVEVLSSDGTLGSATNGTFASKLSVTSSVTTSQASVRSNFYAVGGIVKTPKYSVDVQGASDLTYKWYYVGRNGTQHLIENANGNVLTTNKSLYEKAYKDNSYHKVGIVCEIYSGGQLIKTVDQTTNSSFYMTVVITRR